VLLASLLRGRGYAVCVLDADSTNIRLHRALGIDQAPVPLMEYFGGMVCSGGPVTYPVDDPAPWPGPSWSWRNCLGSMSREPRKGSVFSSRARLTAWGRARAAMARWPRLPGT
jgi:hypothetical protein